MSLCPIFTYSILYFVLVHTTGKYPLCHISCGFGPVPSGKLEVSIDKSILMSLFFLKSFSQLYHSFGEDVNVSGNRFVAGCIWSSTRKTAGVGLQVFPLYCPAPINSL